MALTVALVVQVAALLAGVVVVLVDASTIGDDTDSNGISIVLDLSIDLVVAVVVDALAACVAVAVTLSTMPRGRIAAMMLAGAVQAPVGFGALITLDGMIGAVPLAAVCCGLVVLVAVALPTTRSWARQPTFPRERQIPFMVTGGA